MRRNMLDPFVTGKNSAKRVSSGNHAWGSICFSYTPGIESRRL